MRCKHKHTKIHTFVSVGGEITEYLKCVSCGYSKEIRTFRSGSELSVEEQIRRYGKDQLIRFGW